MIWQFDILVCLPQNAARLILTSCKQTAALWHPSMHPDVHVMSSAKNDCLSTAHFRQRGQSCAQGVQGSSLWQIANTVLNTAFMLYTMTVKTHGLQVLKKQFAGNHDGVQTQDG